jgi:hypothetical protein
MSLNLDMSTIFPNRQITKWILGSIAYNCTLVNTSISVINQPFNLIYQTNVQFNDQLIWHNN